MNKLLILILILLFAYSYKKKEYFCTNNNGDICKFTSITLPLELNFMFPEIKYYGESWAKDIYNLLFNSNNEFYDRAISENYTLEEYFVNDDVCYIHNSATVDGIVQTLNTILVEKYDLLENFELIKKEDTVESYFFKLRELRYNLFSKFFDEEKITDGLLENNTNQVINFSILKSYIFYLLMDVKDKYYIDNNLRYGIYLYLYEKNAFEIQNNEDNERYQYLIIIIIDVLKRYIKYIFDSEKDNLEDLSISKIRNLLINNSIIDYNLVKKDLCYI